MQELVLAGLIVTVIMLWTRLESLMARVRTLELGAAPQYAAPAPYVPEPAEPAPSPWRRPAQERAAPRVVAEPERPAKEEPLPAPEPEVPTPEPVARRRVDFEELFGRRLPIWAGGITLAVAGFLIVKYSIEAGLLSPLVRVLLGLLFGAGPRRRAGARTWSPTRGWRRRSAARASRPSTARSSPR